MPSTAFSLGAASLLCCCSPLIGFVLFFFGKVGTEGQERVEESTSSPARQEKETESSGAEDARTKKVKLVPGAGRTGVLILPRDAPLVAWATSKTPPVIP